MIDWIWTVDLWCWKWPPYQLSYNHCPKMSYFSIPIPMLQTKLWNSLVGTFEYAMYSYISCTVKVLQLRLQHVFYKRIQYIQGRGGGQVVSVLTFYSDDPSLNPAEAYSFFLLKCVLEKNENKQKEAGVGPFLKNTLLSSTRRWHCISISILQTANREWLKNVFQCPHA